jgi:hypothetical protein
MIAFGAAACARWALSAAALLAGEPRSYQPTPAEDAGRAARGFVERIAALGPRLASLELDPDEAVGVQSPGGAAEILIVPVANLLPDRDNPFLAQDVGLPVAAMRFQGVVLHGVDPDRCFPDPVDGDGGYAALLTARRISSAEFRFEIWGPADGPLAASPIFVQRTSEPRTVRAAVRAGLLDLCWFGRYEAFFPIDSTRGR